MEDKIMKLVLEVSKKEEELNQLNKTIDDLTLEIKKNKGEEENENLKLLHQLSESDIKEYKEQIKLLESEIKLNSESIANLKKENASLKKDKKVEENEQPKKIANIKDFSKKFGINLVKKFVPSLSKEIQKEVKKEEIPKKILDECLQKKKNYEKLFEELAMKCNNYYEEERKQKKLVEDYKIMINKMNNEIQNLDNNFNIQFQNLNLNLNDGKQILEEICLKVALTSSALMDLEESYLGIKQFQTFENILNNIYNNLEKINKKEYYNEDSLKEMLNEIKKSIEEIQKICLLADEQLASFNNKNTSFEKQINELKEIQKKYKKENVKRNNSIRQSLMQSRRNQDNNNNMQNNNDNGGGIDLENLPIAQSIIIKPKGSKEDLYKTTYLFSKEEDVNSADYAELLEKNWHEICYVYDNYDIYDVYYTLKAVGLPNNSTFKNASFNLTSNCEVNLLTVNGVKTKFEKRSYMIEFKINLKNLETAKIHIKYKELKNKNNSNSNNLNPRGYYGITPKTNDKLVGKFILILKGSFDIMNFDDYFLIKNLKNKNESEYIWGGIVPPDGKQTLIKFTKRKAKWNVDFNIKGTQNNGRNVDYFQYFVNLKFFGLNNNIIDFKFSSPQTNNIYLDEEKRQFIAEYKNKNKFDFNLNMKLENNSRGLDIDLTDEEVLAHMPKEDIRDQDQLKIIAKKIIEDFDKEHKNSEFEYHDFMKIGSWVYKNIKYNLAYSGKQKISALNIYKNRAGVCHHLTRLSNALLYSIGYKVAYISGYAMYDNETTFSNKKAHAWSIIKIGNKWYSFDSTWNLLKGKVPISHVFSNFDSESTFSYSTSGNNISVDHKLQGKLLKN